MEPEGSLSCSQGFVTGPFPEPDESNLHLLTPIFLILNKIVNYFLNILCVNFPHVQF